MKTEPFYRRAAVWVAMVATTIFLVGFAATAETQVFSISGTPIEIPTPKGFISAEEEKADPFADIAPYGKGELMTIAAFRSISVPGDAAQAQDGAILVQIFRDRRVKRCQEEGFAKLASNQKAEFDSLAAQTRMAGELQVRPPGKDESENLVRGISPEDLEPYFYAMPLEFFAATIYDVRREDGTFFGQPEACTLHCFVVKDRNVIVRAICPYRSDDELAWTALVAKMLRDSILDANIPPLGEPLIYTYTIGQRSIIVPPPPGFVDVAQLGPEFMMKYLDFSTEDRRQLAAFVRMEDAERARLRDDMELAQWLILYAYEELEYDIRPRFFEIAKAGIKEGIGEEIARRRGKQAEGADESTTVPESVPLSMPLRGAEAEGLLFEDYARLLRGYVNTDAPPDVDPMYAYEEANTVCTMYVQHKLLDLGVFSEYYEDADFVWTRETALVWSESVQAANSKGTYTRPIAWSECTDYLIGGVPVRVPMPPGYIDSREFGPDILETVALLLGPERRVLAVYLSHEDGKRLDMGEDSGLNNYVVVQTIVSAEDANVDSAFFAGVKEGARQALKATPVRFPENRNMEAVENEVSRKLDQDFELSIDVVNGMSIIAEGEDYFINCVLSGVSSNVGGVNSSKRMATTSSTVRISNKLLQLGVSDAYTGEEDSARNQQFAKEWMQRTFQANGMPRVEITAPPVETVDLLRRSAPLMLRFLLIAFAVIILLLLTTIIMYRVYARRQAPRGVIATALPPPIPTEPVTGTTIVQPPPLPWDRQ